MTKEQKEHSEKLERETCEKVNREITKTVNQIIEGLKDVQPLTPEEIEEMRRKAHETDEMKKLDAEIKQLEIVNSVFEKHEKHT